MKNYILKYNQINESNELDNLSLEEVERLVELGLIDEDLLKIYNYVKNGSRGPLDLHNSKLEYLPNWLTEVNGKLNIEHSDILDIPDRIRITGSIFIASTKILEFRRTIVYDDLGLSNTLIKKLPDGLKILGEYFGICGVQFEEIPKNLIISGSFYIAGSNLEQFSDTELHKMYKISGTIHRD
jgi:hypothetical protein